LKSATERYAPILGLTPQSLSEKLQELERLFAGAADKPAAIAKGRLTSLAEATARTGPALVRLVSKTEAETRKGDGFDRMNQLEEVIRQWRSSKA
jgi:hypothetical protein